MSNPALGMDEGLVAKVLERTETASLAAINGSFLCFCHQGLPVPRQVTLSVCACMFVPLDCLLNGSELEENTGEVNTQHFQEPGFHPSLARGGPALPPSIHRVALLSSLCLDTCPSSGELGSCPGICACVCVCAWGAGKGEEGLLPLCGDSTSQRKALSGGEVKQE